MYIYIYILFGQFVAHEKHDGVLINIVILLGSG